MSSMDKKGVEKDIEDVSPIDQTQYDIFHSGKYSSLIVRQRFFDIFRKKENRKKKVI